MKRCPAAGFFLPGRLVSCLVAMIFLQLAAISTSAADDGPEVINAGVGGNSTVNLLKRVEKDVISHQPDSVVLMVGTNDRLNSGKFVSIADYEKNVVQLVRKIRSAGAWVYLVTPPPCIESLLFSRHDPQNFADQSPNERMTEVAEVLKKIAKTENVMLVDLHGHLVENDLAGEGKKSILKTPPTGVEKTACISRRKATESWQLSLPGKWLFQKRI